MAEDPNRTALLEAELDAIDLDELPRGAREIVSVIGLQPAIRLVSAFGGLQIWIPDQPHDDHPFARVLSTDRFMDLCRQMGKSYIVIPLASTLARLRRNRRLVRLRKQGHTPKELARMFGITERTVYRILERHGESREQQ